MYFDGEDVNCVGDYYIQSKSYYSFFDGYYTGRRYYWNNEDYSYDCSNVMFSDALANVTDEYSYATEL